MMGATPGFRTFPAELSMTNPRLTSRSTRVPPVTILAASAVVGLVVAVVVTALALGRPWLGLSLVATVDGKGAVVEKAVGPSAEIPLGTVIFSVSGGGDSLEFEPKDFTVEPDGMMGDYGTYRRFLNRQDVLSGIQGSSMVVFTSAKGQEFSVVPDLSGRPIGSLPPDFWVQLLVGLIAWQVSVAVFAFRSGETSARYLLLSGAATLIFAPAAAVYTTREFSVPGEIFQWASDLNFFGGSVFAASFVALLLYYPRRIAPSWVGWSVVSLYVVWFVAQQVGAFESMTFARRFLVMVGVLVTFVLAGVHWFLSRKDPVARAALQWFLLSWMLGTSLFSLFILLPQMFGVDTSPIQGYAFLLFLLVYGGLAFGILRYRLFELGDWWRRIATWTGVVLLMVLLDVLFLAGLNLSSGLSISLTLLICGLIWLPLRAWIWSRWSKNSRLRPEDLFGRVMDVALAPPGGEDRVDLWRQLLREVFDPLGIEGDGKPGDRVATHRDGLAMTLPALHEIPAMKLEYAHGGRRLFSPHDATLAGELIQMLNHAMESRSSFESGVNQERRRIARDMHDNIGAQLLAALHSKDATRKDETIRETLSDLRDLINNSSVEGLSFEETLAELRVESADRLAVSGVELHWTSDEGDADGLHPDAAHALRSIVREAISNVIKHASAQNVHLMVRRGEESVSLEIVDDGKGFDPRLVRSGHGLSNMRSRIVGLNGKLEIEAHGSGTRLAACFPIHQRSA